MRATAATALSDAQDLIDASPALIMQALETLHEHDAG
jgi:hypothetical protein